MKFLIKKNYIILVFAIIFLVQSTVYARETKNIYTSENISNYFLGIVSNIHNDNNQALTHLKKVKIIKNSHSQFNIEFIRTLILLEKYKSAFDFSKDVWHPEELFFEADLLLGLSYFKKKDYNRAEKYFDRLNKISYSNLIFDNFIGNILIAWSKAEQGYKEESFKIIEKIPAAYFHLKRTQDIFLKCYFDSQDVEQSFEELVDDDTHNFSRYNFFLINYLLSNQKLVKAEKVIKKSRKQYSANLLLKQTEVFFKNNEIKKITDFFNCKNPQDSMAEFFYVIANLYASEKNYKLSNFYLKISLFLNENFLSNKALLAENFYYLKNQKKSKKNYSSLKPLGSVYAWYASKNIATILTEEKGLEYSVAQLEKAFKELPNINYEQYYELANFYKENEYYKKSIKYYSLSLEQISTNHFLVPKILDRRGTSYERIGNWEKAEADLVNSLKILPDQPHVLNYLAYTWIDKGINLDKGLEMLKKAAELRDDDGYIIDSLGWAYYAKKNYTKAEFYLQRAVELLPSDPIINDHYADTLWMLNKNIQARYFWKSILNLGGTKEQLKKEIINKINFGISKKL